MTHPTSLGALALVALALASSAAPSFALDVPVFHGPTVAWRPSETRAWMSFAEANALQGPTAQTGWAVITEFMKDPNFVADTKGEWIEIYNNLPWRLNLEGWVLADDAGSHHVIQAGGLLCCRPGQTLVLGNNGDTSQNGRVPVNYVWSGFSLANTSDQIVLYAPDGTLVDRVDYTSSAPWPSAAGKALSLSPSTHNALDNDDGANWCLATTRLSALNPDTGTPGRDNDPCR